LIVALRIEAALSSASIRSASKALFGQQGAAEVVSIIEGVNRRGAAA
jgi:hypothetical protein